MKTDTGEWVYEPIECPYCNKTVKGIGYVDDADWERETSNQHCWECRDKFAQAIHDDKFLTSTDKTTVIRDAWDAWASYDYPGATDDEVSGEKDYATCVYSLQSAGLGWLVEQTEAAMQDEERDGAVFTWDDRINALTDSLDVFVEFINHPAVKTLVDEKLSS